MKTYIAFAVCFLLFAESAAGQSQAWIRQLGTSRPDYAFAVASDSQGGVYTTGYTLGNFGGQTAGSQDIWLARHDGSGNHVWTRQLGTSTSDAAWAATPDGYGGVFVCGHTFDNLGAPVAGQADAWLARYDSSGIQSWIRQLGTSTSDNALAVVADGSGGVLVAGSTGGALGGVSAGGSDAWLSRYDGAGNQAWIRQYGTIDDEGAYAAATDGAGGVYLAGWIDVASGSGGSYDYDGWLGHFDGNGNQTWIRHLGTSGFDFVQAAASDGVGGVFVGGSTGGSLSGISAGADDAWVARYDGAGNQTWIRQLGTSMADYIRAAAVDGLGGVYVGGDTSGGLGGPSGGGRDVWLAHFNSAGTQTWTRQIGTSTNDLAYAVAADGAGGVYTCGETSGSLGGPGVGANDIWLARYDTPLPAPVTYCVAKVNSLACVPAIGWSGSPTVSGPTDDFFVTGSNVINRKSGILIWGTQPAAIPFNGGTLCISPPIVRTPGQNSGGNPAPVIDCSGQYSFHFGHGYIQTYFLAVGQTIRTQYWSRDPGFASPNDVGLTDALSFTLLP